MKKTYIQPSIEAVKIQLSQMVMQSAQQKFSDPINPNQALSKRNDFVEIELDED